jgi:hypothetical protein
MNYIYTLWLGYTNFPETFRPFQKPRCQKSVIKKVHIAKGYVPRVWRQVKMVFIPATGKVNYTQAKAYCPISLLYFMQKMMQKFETMNVRDETFGNFPYIYKNLL